MTDERTTDTSTHLVDSNQLFANADTRTVRGLVLPYGEASSPSVSGAEPVTFSKGSVSIPADAAVLTLNVEHDRFAPVGRAVSVTDTDAGVVAEFAIARTPEGDDVLRGIASGRLTRLSAEVTKFVRQGAQAVSAKLTGAALTTQGAFASAALFSVLPDNEATEQAVTPQLLAELQARLDALEAAPDAQAPTPVDADVTPSALNEKDDDMADAIVPDGVVQAPEEEKSLDASGLFGAIAYAKASGDYAALQAEAQGGSALFALSDVKISGSSTLGLNTVQPKWLGQLWEGNDEIRQVIPELSHGDLEALEVKGFRFTTPPTVAAWTGNKTDIPSGSTAVAVISGSIQRFAAGYDIAREFYDIPAGRPVVEAFVNKLVSSYATVSDTYVMGQLITAAGAGTNAETYPAGITAPVGRIAQGALQVIAGGGTPTFAFVSADMYKALVYTPKDQVTEFLSGSMGLTGGSYAGITVKPHASLTTGQVLVGDKRAATVFELPGSPIRVNALDIAKGGVDEAVFGYVGFLVERPEALALIKTAA